VYRVKSAPFDNPFARSEAEAAFFDAPPVPIMGAADTRGAKAVVVRRAATQQGRKAPMSLAFAVTLCVCIVVFTFSTFMFVCELIPQIKAKREMEELRSFNVGKTVVVQSKDSEQKRDIPDFEVLTSQNSDIVGWIYLEEAAIDHPIVKGKDNDYYLNHTFKKQANANGSVFMDYRDKADFSSQNTLIYGHNMKNGSMFAKLKKYREQESYEKQPVFSIYVPGGKVFHYQVFSTIRVDPYYDYRKAEYGDDFSNFIMLLKKNSLIKSSATISSTDKIAALSTCSGSNSEYRLVVFGVLLNKDGNDIDLTKIKP
jgi:sortase B